MLFLGAGENFKGSYSLMCWRETTDDIRRASSRIQFGVGAQDLSLPWFEGQYGASSLRSVHVDAGDAQSGGDPFELRPFSRLHTLFWAGLKACVATPEPKRVQASRIPFDSGVVRSSTVATGGDWVLSSFFRSSCGKSRPLLSHTRLQTQRARSIQTILGSKYLLGRQRSRRDLA